MAESVFRQVVADRSMSDHFSIDSCGTANYHSGENPDHRCVVTLANHGIYEYSKARQVRKHDLENFDLVLAMDHSNYTDLEFLARNKDMEHVKLFRSFDPEPGDMVVPDPYYGNMDDFEKVYNMVYRTSETLLDRLIEQKKLK